MLLLKHLVLVNKGSNPLLYIMYAFHELIRLENRVAHGTFFGDILIFIHLIHSYNLVYVKHTVS